MYLPLHIIQFCDVESEVYVTITRKIHQMAEAIAAISLAANIVQFIDFTSKVISTSNNLYSSSTTGSDWLQTITTDLTKVSASLKAPLARQNGNAVSENDRELLLLAGQCEEIATELLTTLSTLRRKKESIPKIGHTPEALRVLWGNFRTALKTIWKEDKILELEKRVESFRQQLVLRILVSLRFVVHVKICFQNVTGACSIFYSGGFLNRAIGKHLV